MKRKVWLIWNCSNDETTPLLHGVYLSPKKALSSYNTLRQNATENYVYIEERRIK